MCIIVHMVMLSVRSLFSIYSKQLTACYFLIASGNELLYPK